ncbi:MAG: hypothetical protein UY81_C0074G0007 [Candidatus Giovannonibacteria bacterium GW2011_GWA2_53_7]|uniref:Band 7 domain-containing protein n=1 Tax=Candidatus Giovannonibacteria bacterium GW2011_GWA2_53_7 TaxID=1618650 RepID=A0A0G2A0Z6_9BACT|nr:MAG: hypothetical protein UY81_C0074G0007 [Candidatus Giovannonibacteria bacterium GW2011_GWA2_53_7]
MAKKKILRKKAPKVVSGLEMIAIGAGLTIALSLVTWLLFRLVIHPGPIYDNATPWWKILMYSSMQIGIVGWFFLGGLVKVPVPSKGLPLLLGKRKRDWRIHDEGWSWTLPTPFMFLDFVSLERRILEIKDAKVSAQGTEIVVSSTLEWQIANIYTFFSIGESVIRAGLEALVLKIIRDYCADKSSDQLVKDTTGLADALKISLADDNAQKNWGIKYERILIEKIDLPTDVKAAYAAKDKEAQERVAEKTQIDARIEQMKALKKEFPDLSDGEIRDMVQTETGKVTRVVYDGNLGAIGALVDGIAGTTKKGGK